MKDQVAPKNCEVAPEKERNFAVSVAAQGVSSLAEGERLGAELSCVAAGDVSLQADAGYRTRNISPFGLFGLLAFEN